jgi:ABC-type multidrug transport system fused ATPase/permease subunit
MLRLQVMLDGVDIKRLSVPWLRSMIGLVSQEPVMFKTSIFENILHGNRHASTSQVSIVALQRNPSI